MPKGAQTRGPIPIEELESLLLAVQEAGQPIAAVYERDKLDEDNERRIEALTQLAGAIWSDFRRRDYVPNAADHAKAHIGTLTEIKRTAQELAALLESPGVGFLLLSELYLRELQNPEAAVPTMEVLKTCLGALIHSAENALPGLRARSHRPVQQTWGRTGREVLFAGLENTFRQYVIHDDAWLPSPSISKSNGPDPFTVFVCGVTKAMQEPLSPASVARIMRGVLASRAPRTNDQK